MEANSIPVHTEPQTPLNRTHPPNAREMGTTLTLEWDAGERSGLKYDVYFSTDSTLNRKTLISSQQTENFLNLPLLHNNTNYYWKVVVWEGYDYTTGHIWSFTTELTTTVSYNPYKNTDCDKYSPHKNFAGFNFMLVGDHDDAQYVGKAFMCFDLKSMDIENRYPIPVGANIFDDTVKLALFIHFVHPRGGTSSWLPQDTIEIKRAASFWSEKKLTWSNQPQSINFDGGTWYPGAFSSENHIAYTAKTLNGFTRMIRSWILNSSQNFGIILELRNHSGAYMDIATSNFPDSSKWPKLEITYSW